MGKRLFVAALLGMIAIMSVSATYAGIKHVHNDSVKAQCAASTKAMHLTGEAYHREFKKCYHASAFASRWWWLH